MREFDSVRQGTGQAAPPTPAQPTRDAIGDQVRAQVRADIDNAIRSAEDAANGGQANDVSVVTHPDGGKSIHLPGGRTIHVNGDGVTVTGDVPGMPGMGPRDMDFSNAVPTGAVDIVQSLGFTLAVCVVGFPLARAFGRWIDRRGSTPKLPSEVMTRLSSIENAVESVAVEVERISEGQRFTTKLLNERASRDLQVPVGPGERVSR